jgi:predicted nuclease of predicted toxin-antitoxin system
VKFLADENIPREVVAQLRKAGYGVDYIIESGRGAPDDSVLDKAMTAESVLLTADRDFGEMIFREGRKNCGVILIRLFGLTQELKAKIIMTAISRYNDALSGNFTVITPGAIRIRKRI